jgi:hypothetical protein
MKEGEKQEAMQPQRMQGGYAATKAVFTAETKSSQRSEYFLTKKFSSAYSAPFDESQGRLSAVNFPNPSWQSGNPHLFPPPRRAGEDEGGGN